MWNGDGVADNDYLDPLWDGHRQRVSAALTFWPTEFSRLRLQGSLDATSGADDRRLGGDARRSRSLIGAHGAHAVLGGLVREEPDQTLSGAVGWDCCAVLALGLGRRALRAGPAAGGGHRARPGGARPGGGRPGGQGRVAVAAHQDPHFVDAKPSLALVLNRADLLLQVGLDLEVGWLPTLLVGARNPRIQPGSPGHLDCSQFVHRLDVPAGPVDRSQGDIHPGGNPHYLYDPRAAAAVARGIAARLSELDAGTGRPASRATGTPCWHGWRRPARAGRSGSAPLRGAPIVTYHKTFSYLADWLGLRAGRLPRTQARHPAQPAPRGQGCWRWPSSSKVRLVLQETHYPDATVEAGGRAHPRPAGARPRRHQLPRRRDRTCSTST